MHLRACFDPVTAAFTGLTLCVADGRRPGLLFEYGGAGRIRLSRGEERLLWARVEQYYTGAWLLRRRSAQPLAIVPPIRAHEARGQVGVEAWMKWFARALDQSAFSPLSRGKWQLTELRPSSAPTSTRDRRGLDRYDWVDVDGVQGHSHGLRTAFATPRAHYERWDVRGSGGTYPLRESSAADAARVKAWRKHARAGTLPPILSWWVRPLDMHLVLDGHDRLQAAAAQDVPVSAIVLWQVYEAPVGDDLPWRDALVHKYERAFEEETKLSGETRVRLSESLDHAFRDWRYPVTRARAHRDLQREWRDEVSAELADDPETCARMLREELDTR